MSYDTTVHEAIDPPVSRLTSQRGKALPQAGLRAVIRHWIRPAAVVALTVSILLVVNWVVAILSSVQQATLENGDLIELELSGDTNAFTGQ